MGRIIVALNEYSSLNQIRLHRDALNRTVPNPAEATRHLGAKSEGGPNTTSVTVRGTSLVGLFVASLQHQTLQQHLPQQQAGAQCSVGAASQSLEDRMFSSADEVMVFRHVLLLRSGSA